MNNSKIQIYPSLIASSLLSLGETIEELEPHCNGFHIDIMDNHFVPNLTWGADLTNAIAAASSKPLFVHIMADDPMSIIDHLDLKPKSIIAFHIESKFKKDDIIEFIHKKNWLASIAISPKTSLEEIFEHLHIFNQVLLMSVNPGYSGQRFLPDSIARLERLAEFIKNENLDCPISMDGGINKDNIAELAQRGCSIFGIANAIFAQPDPVKALEELYAAVNR